jgi:hypothetical protein
LVPAWLLGAPSSRSSNAQSGRFAEERTAQPYSVRRQRARILAGTPVRR